MIKTKYYNIIYLLISIILFITAGNVNAKDGVYDSYKIGDKINYNGMDFYVIANSDSNQDYVTLLKKTPLSVDEVDKYGAGHVNRYTEESIGTAFFHGGYGGMAYYTSETCGYVNGSYVETGCTTDYAQSDIKYAVDAWAADKLQSNDLKEDNLGYKVRLITKEELMDNLGYNHAEEGPSYFILNPEYTPSWVYNKKYNYWTMSLYGDSALTMLSVHFNGDLGYGSNVYSNNASVRPVINLKKIMRSSSANDYDYNKQTYKKGDVVYYKGNQYYVLKDAPIDDSTVTLLKATPLTTGQVKEYGQNHVNMYMPEWDEQTIGYYKRPYDSQGYGSIAYYSDEKCGFVSMAPNYYQEIVSGCTVEYDKSDVKYVLDNWAKNYLDDNDLSKDKQGYKYRLITLDELNELGYSADAEGNYSYNANVPRWIYGNYKYFTMTPSDDGNHSMIVVDKDGKLNVSTYNMVTTLAQEYFGTIRPVITIKKVTKDEVSKEVVSVPDTLLSMPILGVIIGTLISIVAVIIIYFILKNKHKKTT